MDIYKKMIERVNRFGMEKTYALLMLLSISCFALLIFTTTKSWLSSLLITSAFFIFGLIGIVCIYFKAMPGFGKPIIGTYAIISGYTFLISGWGACILIIYILVRK